MNATPSWRKKKAKKPEGIPLAPAQRALRLVTLLVVGLAVVVFSRAALRAHRCLVTLDVRDADIASVLSTIRWQTWEKIDASKDLAGKVTLTVEDMPLEEVLEILSTQLPCRWNAVYPVYADSASLRRLRAAIRGTGTAEQSGWKSWQNRGRGPMGGGGGGGMFASTAPGANRPVTMEVEQKDADFVALALSRVSRAIVVVQDGVAEKLSFKLDKVTLPEAVKVLAGELGMKWNRLYVLRGNGGGNRRGGPPVAGEAPIDERRGPPPDGGPREPMTPERQAEMDKQIEAMEATMTPEERAQFEKNRKQMEEIRKLPPEERRAKMEELMKDPAVQARMQEQMQTRMVSRLKNSTPEQRVERDQRRLQRMKSQGNNPSGGASTQNRAAGNAKGSGK